MTNPGNPSPFSICWKVPLTMKAPIHFYKALAIGAPGEGREIACGRGVRAARLQTIKADLARDVSQSIDEIARRQGVTAARRRSCHLAC